MKEPILSIIMPIYNAELYLKKSIESIIQQNFKNFELILINDGSSDNSLKILEEFKKKDDRLIIINIKNSGVSNARNIGISRARGKYITFVDSDDYIDRNIYEDTLKQFDDDKIDIVIFNYYYEFEKAFDNTTSSNIINILDKKEFYHKLLNDNNCRGFVWNKIYKKELINFEFDKDIHMCEDLLFNIKYMQQVKKAKLIDKKYYHYIQHNNNSINNLNIKTTTVMEAYFRIEKISKEEGFTFDLNTKKTLLMHALKNMIIYKKFNITSREKIEECNKIINKYYYIILFSEVDIITKIKIILLRRFNIVYLLFKDFKRSRG